jgi:hypothetical protein
MDEPLESKQIGQTQTIQIGEPESPTQSIVVYITTREIGQ